MPDAARWELLVKRDDLAVTEVREAATPELDADDVELAVERSALTQNNVAYARFGDPPLNFWSAFPAPDPAWGRLPVWGFVRVTRSRHPGFSAGDRFFGLLPSASHHVVRPGPAARGFVDTMPGREVPNPWYQTFRPAGPVDERDDRRTVLRPIYPASFHAADVVTAKAGDGPLTLLLTSASSKVAIGTAHRLRAAGNVRTVGLTSAPRVGVVSGLHLYDEVLDYRDQPAVGVDGPVALLDLAGDNALVTAIHQRFRDRLVYVGLGGWTHGVQPPPDLTDPEPEPFFAPWVEAAAIEAEGEDPFFDRYHAAEEEFLVATESWLTLTAAGGPGAVADVFRSLVDGTHPATTCTVLRP
jgi:Protein of unknown function (DUF2855)